MEPSETNPVDEAARQIADAQATKPKRTRKPKAEPKPEPHSESQPEVTKVVFVIDAKDVSATVEALLSKFSEKTKTDKPSRAEVEAMSNGLAFGLQHMEITVDPKTGPWVPLGVAAIGFAVPRLIESLMRAGAAKEAAESGPFPEVEIPANAEVRRPKEP